MYASHIELPNDNRTIKYCKYLVLFYILLYSPLLTILSLVLNSYNCIKVSSAKYEFSILTSTKPH